MQEPTLYGRVLGLANLGLMVLDADQRIIFWNQWLASRSGMAAPRVLGLTLVEAFPELSGKRIEQSLHTALASNLPSVLPQNSHPYKGDAKPGAVAGDFAGTHVGDESDTSPYNETARTESISTAEYLRNMNLLIAWLTQAK